IGQPLHRIRRLSEALSAFAAYNSNKSALLTSTLLAIVSHLASALAWWFALMLLGGRTGFLALVAICCMLTIVRTLPLTPMGLGIADGAAEFLFNSVGVAEGAELQMLMRAVMAVILLGSGLAYLQYGRAEAAGNV
ncbi:MAG: flippase-like domain-containing protein, partial [Pseudomonadales bacterium]|nr:flippase-like domain-containing protein [Pseudomonadales bacterium]